MALWILNRPPEKCSLGELQTAEFLGDLSDDWIIRWGFHYHDNHGTLREGDFLVLGPKGNLLVLEAKVGNLCHNPYTGKWSTADGDHPQMQLDAEWCGVMQEVNQTQGGRPRLFVARALALPGTSVAPGAADHHGIDRELIYDRRDLQDFTQIWDKRMPKADGRSREIFFDSFGRDATPKAVRHFVDETDRALIRQTEVGFDLLDNLEDNHQFLVRGGAGSGKTFMALEQATRWANDGARVLFLCYNLALTAFIRELVARARARKRLRAGDVVVRAWEELASELITRVGLEYDVPAGSADRTHFYEQTLPHYLVQIVRDKSCPPEFDCMIVDEGQDHDTAIPGFPSDWSGPGWWGVYWSLLKEGSRSPVAVFLDPAQRPQFRGGGGFSLDALLNTENFHPVQVRLKRTVRYSLPIFKHLKSLAMPALKDVQEGLVQQGPLPDGPLVVEQTAGDGEAAALANRIIRGWIDQGWCKPDQVLVLSARSKKTDSTLRGCNELAGCPLVNQLERRTGEIGMLSVHRAKGLDALAVLLMDYGPKDDLYEFDQIGYFMGSSRARQLLGVISTIPAKGS